MKINQLATLTNVPTKTIRYYEEVALLPPPLRLSNGYRHYSDKDVERLVFIRRCRELQIPVDQIKVLIQVQNDETSSCKEVDLLIAQQLEKIRTTIAELSLLEQTLHSLTKSCQNDVISECGILKKLTQE
jgi:DNA-binding transcriptional MerR regulator